MRSPDPETDFVLGLAFYAFVALVATTIYFIPSIIAYFRGHHNATAIIVLNFFAGWSFLGYLAALIWACTQTDREKYVAFRGFELNDPTRRRQPRPEAETKPVDDPSRNPFDFS